MMYLKSCFWLTVPVLLWNLLLSESLPEPYRNQAVWNDVPAVLLLGEYTFRLLFFAATMLMPLCNHKNTAYHKAGIILYAIGVPVYFAAWLMLLRFPDCTWSVSLAGQMAPAYTPVLWMFGICLIGNSFFFNIPFKRWPLLLICFLFLAFHNIHAFLVLNGVSI